MESQGSLIATVTALLATAAFPLNQQMPSLPATLLLSYIILMFIVCESIFTLARAESGLLARQCGIANNAHHFHMTSKVGLQAYHIRRSVVSGALVESVKFGEA